MRCWQCEEDYGGGALMNQGAHTVDLLLWLAGDVDRVSATTRTLLHSIEVEDTAVAFLEYANGAVGTLEVTTAAYPGFPRRLTVTGSEGTIVVEGDRVTTIALRREVPPPPTQTVNQNPSMSSPVVSDVAGHRRVILDFIQALQTGRAPLCDGRDGRRSVALIEAAYESAKGDRPQRLSS
jgi:predicted dehydrogenase